MTISPSALDRIVACVGSEALPHVDRASSHARRGTLIHEYLANARQNRQIALQLCDPSVLDVCQAIDLDRLFQDEPGGALAEVSFAYDVETETARHLGERLTREAVYRSLKRGEIAGTIDVFASNGTNVFVRDWKAGSQRIRAGGNHQLLSYALFAARAMRATTATVEIIQLDEAGEWTSDRIELTEFDLQGHAALLRQVTRARDAAIKRYKASGELTLHEGDHCRWCPAFWTCPAKIKLLQNLPSLTGFEGLNETNAVEIWRRLEATEEVLTRLRFTIADYVRASPIQTPDGTTLGERVELTETIRPDKARDALLGALGPVGQDLFAQALETKQTITKKSFHQAVMQTAPKGKGAALERQALDALRDAGAIDTRERRTVCEYLTDRAQRDSKAS